MRRSVEGVMLVTEHHHPHVLLLQATQSQQFKLPGGRLRPGEEGAGGVEDRARARARAHARRSMRRVFGRLCTRRVA